MQTIHHSSASAAFLGTLLGCALLTGACDSAIAADPCGTVAVAGLVITARDSGSDTVLCDAKVLAQDGLYWELLVATPADDAGTCRYVGAFERPGTYRVQAEADGFAQTSQAGVEVVQGVCHVIAQTVNLTLVKAP